MDQVDTHVTVGDIFSSAGDIFGRHLRVLSIAFAALVVGTVVIDMVPGGPEANGGEAAKQFAASLLSFFIQYVAFRTVLDREGLICEGVGRRRYWPLMWSSFVSAMGIGLGMIALVLPGLILLARWSMAPCVIIAEGGGPIGSLGESWRETRRVQWPIVGAFVVFGIVWLIAVGVLVAVIGFGSADLGTTGTAAAFNFAGGALTIASICLSLGIYRLVRVSAAPLEDVFG